MTLRERIIFGFLMCFEVNTNPFYIVKILTNKGNIFCSDLHHTWLDYDSNESWPRELGKYLSNHRHNWLESFLIDYWVILPHK